MRFGEIIAGPIFPMAQCWCCNLPSSTAGRRPKLANSKPPQRFHLGCHLAPISALRAWMTRAESLRHACMPRAGSSHCEGGWNRA
jgi:hypothetical protein